MASGNQRHPLLTITPPMGLDLLQHLQTAVLLLDHNLCISYLNEAAESFLQTSMTNSLGEPLTSLIHLDPSVPSQGNQTRAGPEPLLTEMRNALATTQPFTHREAQIEVFGVGSIRVDYSATPFVIKTSSNTEPMAADALLVELQPIDRKLNIGRDDQRLSSQETTRMLIRGLAHEVKNPLGGIRGSAQLLDAELGDPRLKEYTQVVIQEADRLRNLVDRLLGPNKPPKFAPINIHRVLEHVVRLSFAEHSQPPEIERNYDPSIPKLDADYDQLIQAFLNVIRNALQILAGQDNAKITLYSETLRQFTIGDTNHRLVAHIGVEDNGPGIPSEISDRLFFPMISGRPDGSGLGLAIAQTIIGQHNGLISVESELGCTRFSIYLPLQQPADRMSTTHASTTN